MCARSWGLVTVPPRFWPGSKLRPKLTNLNVRPGQLPSPSMKLILALVVWLVMGLVIGLGVVMAVKGHLWLLVASLLAFAFAFARIGCKSH